MSRGPTKRMCREYSPVLLDRILRVMRSRHPTPVLVGTISVELGVSLEIAEAALQQLEDEGYVADSSDMVRDEMGFSRGFNVRVLTQVGYVRAGRE